jgi:RimJ/RimL family protein N-acetyltransferase
MEQMPFNEATTMVAPLAANVITATDWQRGLPTLLADHVTLRELRLSDAASLLAMVATEEVSRFISPPPTTLEGFERFIRWAHGEREAGRYVCFAVVPDGMEHAVGLFQVRQLESSFRVAEWGLVIGSPFWGTGVFEQSARLVLDFTFDEIGVSRLEARAALLNGRGNGALRKLGARPEAVLRKSFLRNGQELDQQLWAILADDWVVLTTSPLPRFH